MKKNKYDILRYLVNTIYIINFEVMYMSCIHMYVWYFVYTCALRVPPHTPAPEVLLANSQRVATRVVSEVEFSIFNAYSSHPFNETSIKSAFALLICIPQPYALFHVLLLVITRSLVLLQKFLFMKLNKVQTQ